MNEPNAGVVTPHELSLTERVTRIEGEVTNVKDDVADIKKDVAGILAFQVERKKHDDIVCNVWKALLIFIKYVITPGVPIVVGYLMAKGHI